VNGGLVLRAEHVVDAGVPHDVCVSPDGRWVAYGVRRVGQSAARPESVLWMSPVDDAAAASPLTGGSEAVTQVKWAADSSSLFFLSDREEQGTAQLHSVSCAGGQVEALTCRTGGVEGFEVLAGGRHIALIACDEPDREAQQRIAERDDAQSWSEREPRVRLWLLDLGSSMISPLATFDGRHVVEVARRPDGGPVAVLTWPTSTLDQGQRDPRLHLHDVSVGSVVDLGLAEISANSLCWWRAKDRWHLSYLALTPPGLVGGDAVFDVELATEAASSGRHPLHGAGSGHRNLTAGMSSCPTTLVQVDAGMPLALFADGLDTALTRLDPDERRFTELRRFTGSAEQLTVSGRGDVCSVVLSSAAEPKDAYAGPIQQPLQRVSDVSPILRRIDWGSQERLDYPAEDGLHLDGLLVLPPGASRPDGPFALITVVHGGPQDRYTDSLNLGWHPSAQWLAAAGFAVFLPNPRGGTGRGHAFAAQVAGEVGGTEWTDILTGIDVLASRGVADPNRLGIAGWSHGGFMAAWAVGQTDRFKAAVMGAGISDWGMLAATGQEGAFEAALSGSAGWEGPGPHRHDQRSPISYASKIRTPVLILHGQDDTNVPVSQAEYLHRALVHFDVEHDYITYPRENHSIRERNHQLDVLNRTRDWFQRWL